MSDVATQAQATKDAVAVVFVEECKRIEDRVEQLRRIRTPATEASEDTSQQAVSEATDFLSTLGVEV